MAEYPDNGATGRASGGQTLRADTVGCGPALPLEGSSLDALVQRQSGAPGASHRLAFVPTQVR